MTYYCENCRRTFREPVRYRETYGLPGGWGQTLYCCPHCGVDNEFREVMPHEAV